MKTVQCYMYESGTSEEDAYNYISDLIGGTWKRMNEYQVLESPIMQTFIGIAMNNLARMA